MSLRTRSRKALKAIENVNEVDLIHFDRSNLRAFLLPKSEPALYHIRLEENDRASYPITGIGKPL